MYVYSNVRARCVFECDGLRLRLNAAYLSKTKKSWGFCVACQRSYYAAKMSMDVGQYGVHVMVVGL